MNSTHTNKNIHGIEPVKTARDTTLLPGAGPIQTMEVAGLLAVFDRVGDVFYALCGRFADHSDPVAAHGAHVDVDRPLPHQTRLRRRLLARRGLDEYRERCTPVGQHDMADSSDAPPRPHQLGDPPQ